MKKLRSFLKNLRFSLKQIRLGINKNSVTSVNLYFQDESRFGLITKQKRVVSARGIKPIGKYMHSYKYKWLWGCFSPITGESFCMTATGVCKGL